METKTESRVIDKASGWTVYAYLWPLLDRLAALKPDQREGLQVGRSPMDEVALVIIETQYVQLESDLGETTEKFAVASITVPKHFHCLPLGALQHWDDEGDKSVLAFMRREFHETTGPHAAAKFGQRFMELLLNATRDDLNDMVGIARRECDDAIDTLARGDMDPDSVDRRTQVVTAYTQELRRLMQASELRLCWLKRRGGQGAE